MGLPPPSDPLEPSRVTVRVLQFSEPSTSSHKIDYCRELVLEKQNHRAGPFGENGIKVYHPRNYRPVGDGDRRARFEGLARGRPPVPDAIAHREVQRHCASLWRTQAKPHQTHQQTQPPRTSPALDRKALASLRDSVFPLNISALSNPRANPVFMLPDHQPIQRAPSNVVIWAMNL